MFVELKFGGILSPGEGFAVDRFIELLRKIQISEVVGFVKFDDHLAVIYLRCIHRISKVSIILGLHENVINFLPVLSGDIFLPT